MRNNKPVFLVLVLLSSKCLARDFFVWIYSIYLLELLMIQLKVLEEFLRIVVCVMEC